MYGDLLVVVSGDRWIRVRGLVDDIKAVTAGTWLRDMTPTESSAVEFATLIVYTTAALAGNSTNAGSATLFTLLLVSVSLLGLSNGLAKTFHMHGCVVRVVGLPKSYARRLDLVEELIRESGRRDWAIGLGMIVPESAVKTEREVMEARLFRL